MMHHAFIQAVIEAPDADGPRLIYADWLQDNGEPARADFIRVQIELALASFSRLTTLDLDFNSIGDEGAQILAASASLASLELLGLVYWDIGEAGALALAASESLANLEEIALGQNEVGPRAIVALSQRFGDRLRFTPPV
jgi:uncharacterized protein (TIGR02996 family)